MFSVIVSTKHCAPVMTAIYRTNSSGWAAFATTGNSDNEFIPRLEKYTAENRQTMDLNSKGCTCKKDFITENLNALRYVYES